MARRFGLGTTPSPWQLVQSGGQSQPCKKIRLDPSAVSTSAPLGPQRPVVASSLRSREICAIFNVGQVRSTKMGDVRVSGWLCGSGCLHSRDDGLDHQLALPTAYAQTGQLGLDGVGVDAGRLPRDPAEGIG